MLSRHEQTHVVQAYGTGEPGHMPLTDRCRRRLQGVHPDLVRVVELASKRENFRITEGLRDLERQRELVASKKSKTLNSRHLTGHAVDVVAVEADGSVSYDMDDLERIAKAMRAAAAECGIPIEWGAAAKYGGDFRTFNDSPHFQLPWRRYPAEGVSAAEKIKEAISKPSVALPTAGGAGVAAPAVIPPVPPSVTETMTNGKAWQEMINGVAGDPKFLALLAAGAALFFVFGWLIPKLQDRGEG